MDWANGVPFAIDAAGTIRDVDNVENGLDCGCFCAACRGQLIARQGEVIVHHFAHPDRKECRHALEASLFLMAIALLKETGSILAVLHQPQAAIQPPLASYFLAGAGIGLNLAAGWS